MKEYDKINVHIKYLLTTILILQSCWVWRAHPSTCCRYDHFTTRWTPTYDKIIILYFCRKDIHYINVKFL